MGRFAAEILRLDGSQNVWHHAGDFSTPEGALRSIQRRFSRTQVAARIMNRETGEFINVEGYNMMGTPPPPPMSDQERMFREEIEANYLPADNTSFFPELQQQMRAEQQRFRDTERARNFYEERRQQTLRQRERERDRRVRGFNFVGGENGLEVRSNPRLKKPKPKYKVQWWKDGF